MTGYLRRCWEQRSWRPLTDYQVDLIEDAMKAVDDDEHADLLSKAMPSPFKCRVCDKPAQLELTPEIVVADKNEVIKREYLCEEDIGPFVCIFTDPRVRTWTVTRLP